MSDSNTTLISPLIHIGYHKTGTKWLEHRLFHPDHATFYMTQEMREWCDRFALDNPFEFDVGALHTEYAAMTPSANLRGRQPVLQMERLSGHPHSGGFDSRAIADRLHAVFPTARVLIVVREQVEMIVSCYKQGVDVALGVPLESYIHPPRVGNRLVPAFELRHFAYHHLVAYYQRQFGRERVLVLPFELLKLDAPRFVAAIAELVGREAPADCDARPVHESLGGFACSLRWRLNRVLVRSTLNPTGWTESRRVRRLCDRVARAAAPDWLDRICDQRMHRQVLEATGDYYRASNRRLAGLIGFDLEKLGYAV
jgi:hypothetical protein